MGDINRELLEALDGLCHDYIADRGEPTQRLLVISAPNHVPWRWVRAMQAVEVARQQAEANREEQEEAAGYGKYFFVLATMIRDAVNKYRDSHLQNDADELDRLTHLFNLPPDQMMVAVRREVERGSKPKS